VEVLVNFIVAVMAGVVGNYIYRRLGDIRKWLDDHNRKGK
jgi:hypothetical protein